jgi:hypothetical protein
MFRVLARAMADAAEPMVPLTPVPRSREPIVLSLALRSVLLGLLPLKAFDLLQIGRQHTLRGTRLEKQLTDPPAAGRRDSTLVPQ